MNDLTILHSFILLMNPIQCLVEQGVITPEEGESLIPIYAALPNNATELLRILVALTILRDSE